MNVNTGRAIIVIDQLLQSPPVLPSTLITIEVIQLGQKTVKGMFHSNDVYIKSGRQRTKTMKKIMNAHEFLLFNFLNADGFAFFRPIITFSVVDQTATVPYTIREHSSHNSEAEKKRNGKVRIRKRDELGALDFPHPHVSRYRNQPSFSVTFHFGPHRKSFFFFLLTSLFLDDFQLLRPLDISFLSVSLNMEKVQFCSYFLLLFFLVFDKGFELFSCPYMTVFDCLLCIVLLCLFLRITKQLGFTYEMCGQTSGIETSTQPI